ncbi:hypothetical protein D3C73_937490 [compost metagenome]
MVDPADEVHITICHPTRNVTRSVQLFTRFIWIGDEFFRSKFRPIQITASDPWSTDAQLSVYADRHRIQVRVQNIKAGARDWFTNRYVAGNRQFRKLLLIEAGFDSGFRNTIAVNDTDLRTKALLQLPVIQQAAAIRARN